MKLVITSDKHQYILNQRRKVKGEEVLTPIGHYHDLGKLAAAIGHRLMRNGVPAKGWSPDELLEALAKFSLTTDKILSQLEQRQ